MVLLTMQTVQMEVLQRAIFNSVNTEQKAEALKEEFLKSQAQDVHEETAKDDVVSFFENKKVTDGVKTVGKADSTNTVSKSITTEQKAIENSTANNDANADTENEAYDA